MWNGHSLLIEGVLELSHHHFLLLSSFSESFCLHILFNLVWLRILVVALLILVQSIHFIFLVKRLQSMLLRLLSHEHLLFFFSIVILDSISFFKAGCTQISNIGIIVLILLQNLLFHHVVVLTSCISSMLVPLSLILLILSLFHAEVHHIFKAFILSITGLLHLVCLSTCLMNFLLHPRFFKLEHFNTVLYELCLYRHIYPLVLSLE